MGLLAAIIIFAVVTGYLGQRKGYSFALWAVLGGCFMFVALVVLAMLPDREDFKVTGTSIIDLDAAPRALCPQCGEFIPAKAKVCQFCGYDLVAKPEPNLPLPVSRVHEKPEPAVEEFKARAAAAIPLPKRSRVAEQELLLKAANARSRLAFLVVIPLFFLAIAVGGVYVLKVQKPTTLPAEVKQLAETKARETARAQTESEPDETAAQPEPERKPAPPPTPPPVVVEEPTASTPPPAPVVAAHPAPPKIVRPPTMEGDDEPAAPQPAAPEEKKATRIDVARAELDDANDKLTAVGKVVTTWEKKLKAATSELDKAKAALADAKSDVTAEQANINDANAVLGAAKMNFEVAQANRKLKEANWRLGMAQNRVTTAEKTLAAKQAAWNEVDKMMTLARRQSEECERTIKTKTATVEQLEAAQAQSTNATKQ